MKSRRSAFETELKTLKQNEAGGLKECYEKFLNSLKGILTASQWETICKCL
jgi:hypothetical protein